MVRIFSYPVCFLEVNWSTRENRSGHTALGRRHARRAGGGRWAADRLRDRAARSRRRLGRAICLQHSRRRDGRCRSALRPGARLFYAKTRALLVSHWYVNSNAAVRLTAKTFAGLKANPKIGHADALRRSMAELITRGEAEYAHPAMWAPFVLVGESGR